MSERDQHRHVMSYKDAQMARKGCSRAITTPLGAIPSEFPSPNHDSILVCRAPVAAGKIANNRKHVLFQLHALLRECPYAPSLREQTCPIAKLGRELGSKKVIKISSHKLDGHNPKDYWSYFLEEAGIEDIGEEV